MDAPLVMGHTYAQNPVSAAAGLAVLDYIQQHDLVRAAEEPGGQLLAGLQALIGRHRILGDAGACIDEGAAIYPGQGCVDRLIGDHALVTPPLVITAEQVEDLVGAIDRALSRVEATV